jgi:Protein of unknown function (DUF2934)
VSGMQSGETTTMERQTRKCRSNWVIAVESRNEQHQEIILSTIAKRAYQLFERRGRVHGSDFEDWIRSEQELLQDDFSRDTSQFDCFIESPRNPEMTTILSVTTHSMIAFRSHALQAGEIDLGPDVASVHVFPDEIDTTQLEVNRVGWLLHVHAPKKNHRNAS